jgi:TPR repeat protein
LWRSRVEEKLSEACLRGGITMQRGLSLYGRIVGRSDRLAWSAAGAILCMLSPLVFGQVVPVNAIPPTTLLSSPPAGELAAAIAGNVHAQLAAGKAYNGDGMVRRNYPEAVKWFTAAAGQGSVEASVWLGSCYLYGHGVAQDPSQGVSLIETAGAQNNPVGLRFMGIMYEEGLGVAQNYSQAASWLTKATEKNDPNAFDHLGLLYLHGLGVRKNGRNAISLLTRGARLEDPWAEFHLAELYQSGQVPSGSEKTAVGKPALHPNYEMAVSLYGSSAAQGNRIAAYKLGELYEQGKGVAQDYGKAISYYEEAAYRRFAPAQLALGKMNELGLGTQVDLVTAQVWYGLAEDQGNAAAGSSANALKSKMTPDQVQEAFSRLTEWETSNTAN